MSIEATSAVLNDTRAMGSAKLVLVSLAWHANNDGVAWPSQAPMARHAGVKVRWVRYLLAELVALGLIEADGRARRGTVTWRLRFLTGTPLPVKDGSTGTPLPDTEALIRHPGAAYPGTRVPTNLKEPLRESSTTSEQAVEQWNELATELGLAKVSRLTQRRRRELLTRILDAHGFDGWRQALAAIRQTAFLRGDNPKGFKPTFDWLLGEDAFARVIEGGYDGWKGNGGSRKNEAQRAIEEETDRAFHRMLAAGMPEIDALGHARNGLTEAEADRILKEAGYVANGNVPKLLKQGVTLQRAVEAETDRAFHRMVGAGMPKIDALGHARNGLTEAQADVIIAEWRARGCASPLAS